MLVSTRSVPFQGKRLKCGENTYVAPNASVIGSVKLDNDAGIWYGATVRGDVNPISIGKGSQIMEQAVVHVAKFNGDFGTDIGNNVVVSQGAIVHGCTIQDHAFVAEKAIVMDGCVMSKHSALGAGAVLTKGKTIPTGQYWSGVPASYARDISEKEIAAMAANSLKFAKMCRLHKAESEKSFRDLQEEQNVPEDYLPEHVKDRDDAGIFFKH